MCGGSQVEDNGAETVVENKKMGTPKKFDPTFNGPIKKRFWVHLFRSCTDVICCILFFIFVLGSLAVSLFGFIYGDPYRLIYPTDSNGNICGRGDLKDKPYLMFFDLLQCAKTGVATVATGCPTPQVCVNKCPKTNYFFGDTVKRETIQGESPVTARVDMRCKNGVDPTKSSKSVEELVKSEDCAAYYLKSTPIVGRCIPAVFGDGYDKLSNLFSENNTAIEDLSGVPIIGSSLEKGSEYLVLFMSAAEYVEMIFKDILSSWYLILAFMAFTMLFAFLWIILMRWIAGVMVWVSIFAFIGLLGYATYHCFERYLFFRTSDKYKDLPVVFTTDFSYYLNLKETWLGLGIVAAVVLLIVLLLMLFLCQRIRMAIQLIKEGSKAIGNMIFTLFWPIFPFLMQIIVLGYYIASVIFVATMGSPEFMDEGTNTTVDGLKDGVKSYLKRIPCEPNKTDELSNICNFVKYGGKQYIIPLQVFLLFMFFWLMNFVVALGQMTLAGAFASYYWAFEKPKDVPAFPLLASFRRCFRYHMGSLAFGALIIAIIQMIRVFLEYLDHKLKGSENPVAKFILKCFKCCFYCLEKFMKFLNRNAYIMIAVHGKNFCASAKDAFFLILRNIVRTVVLNKITDFLLFICKIVVVAAAVCGSFFWFSNKIPVFTEFVPTLNFYLTPVILVAIGAYLIASSFFSVYAMAIDTLYLCFLEDLERNDGSADKPYFMSKNMMKILGKKNKSTVL